MMIGESHRHNPTLHVPPWLSTEDPMDEIYCGDYNPLYLQEAVAALRRYLPANEVADIDSDSEISGRDAADVAIDAYSCDHFRMYEFKVKRCVRGRSHDWTECPYAHPGEKARRRDPRKFHYSGTACPEFRKGNCKNGDTCEYAHGVFECWLHPARYRTQPCKDGLNCRRKVCFFAHSAEQLRVLPSQRIGNSGESNNELALRQLIETNPTISPPDTPTAESPPISPMTPSLSRSLGSNSVNEMVTSLRNLHLGKVNSLPASYSFPTGASGYGSPRGHMTRPGFSSLPTTPTQCSTRRGIGYMNFWEEEPAMERVESGRDLRAKMFEKLSKENPLERVDPNKPPAGPDVGWVSELVK